MHSHALSLNLARQESYKLLLIAVSGVVKCVTKGVCAKYQEAPFLGIDPLKSGSLCCADCQMGPSGQKSKRACTRLITVWSSASCVSGITRPTTLLARDTGKLVCQQLVAATCGPSCVYEYSRHVWPQAASFMHVLQLIKGCIRNAMSMNQTHGLQICLLAHH